MRLLVTGATGYLGNAFAADALANAEARGVDHVRVTGRNKDRARNLVDAGAEFIGGDIADLDVVQKLLPEVDAIIHCAGRAGLGGPMSLYRSANQEATAQLVDQARKAGVKRIVNIGTPSIYFDYTDALNRDEDYLPPKMPDNYAKSKYEAEMALLAENGKGIETISIRPRFVAGRGEENILPRLIRMHRAGQLKIMGDGENIVDFTSIDNCVDALWLCLKTPAENCGQAYNITNDDPVKLWPFINDMFEKIGLPRLEKHVPYPVAATVGCIVQTLFLLKQTEPPLTRLGTAVMAKSMTMDVSRAKNQLGYTPRIGNDAMMNDFVDGRVVNE